MRSIEALIRNPGTGPDKVRELRRWAALRSSWLQPASTGVYIRFCSNIQRMLTFEWDAAKARRNLAKHGVSFDRERYEDQAY